MTAPADRKGATTVNQNISSEPATLGIGLGTSSVKAVVTDLTGTLLAQATAEYPIDNPHPGWAETDPDLWWSAITTAVRRAGAASDSRITGIALSGQMQRRCADRRCGSPGTPRHTVGRRPRPAPVGGVPGPAPRVARRLANPLTPGMAGPMLAKVAANEPAAYRATRWALQPKDWVRSRLTGRFESEPSDASATLLYDIPGDTWDLDVAAALGLNPELLPPLLPHPGAPAGDLLTSAARELGLEQGIPVAAGAADTAAAALGSGLTEPHQAQLTIGTGAQIVMPTNTAAVRPTSAPVTHLYRAATETGWSEMAAVLSGGLTLNWVRHLLGASWAELYDSAEAAARSDDPIFLPHLHGERTPYMDTSLRGSWTGLDPRHDRTALMRAALEGVAFTIRAALDALPGITDRIDHLRLAGGGSTSPAWRQMPADVLGYPLRAVHIPAASGRGAALLGARAAGYLDEPALLELIAPQSEPVAEPQGSAAAAYAQRRDRLDRTLQVFRHETVSTAM